MTPMPHKTFTDEERERIQRLYDEHHGKVDLVAKELGISWDTARRWLALLKIRKDHTDRAGKLKARSVGKGER